MNTLMTAERMIKILLENGQEFKGFSFGAETSTSGEVVFNTGMVGYPESLTDPSYRGQILVFTYPLIGNYGIPENPTGPSSILESSQIQVKGVIISDYSAEYSHWSASKSLGEWLKEHNLPGITGIDTRELTKILRENGTMLGKIIFEDQIISWEDPNRRDVVKEVSINNPVVHNEKAGNKRVILIDCGVKNNIIRNLVERDVTVIQVPYYYNFTDLQYDGVFISNGPGDPMNCTAAIQNIMKILQQDIPIFGICLGSQIIALAAGGKTYKLKYGHRSQNQPCLLSGTKRCFITSQNHGFAVDMNSLGKEWEELFINVNDGTNEGFRHRTKPITGIQFHPEANPGPYDTAFLFDEFVNSLKSK